MRALGPNPLHLCSASVADFFLPYSIKNALRVSHICVCVSEHVFSTLHLCSSTRPSFLCGNFQIFFFF